MFTPSRIEARQFLFETWKKFQNNQILTDMEAIALKAVLLHPEYHAALGEPDKYLDRDYLPEFGETNPFLHLSMHMAIEEQLAIDQPPGIRAAFEKLLVREGSEHEAKHRIMDCLAETLWQAQRQGVAPDTQRYLDCLSRNSEER
jgi:Domain of unknown function (DUF1841)